MHAPRLPTASLAALLSLAQLLAQARNSPSSEPAPAALTADLVFRRQVAEVAVAFTALDGHGQPLLALQLNQLQLLDNGRPVGSFTGFRSMAEMPLRLILLLDASASMSPMLADERDAAATLAASFAAPGADISTLVFATQLESPTGPRFTEASLRQPPLGGGTALFDALVESLAYQPPSGLSRRVVLLFTDGEDNFSRHSLAEAIAAAQRAGAIIYAFTVHRRRWQFPGDRILDQLASATGGRAFVIPRYDQILKILPRIETEIRAQYLVSFRPAPAEDDPRFHPLSIKLKPYPAAQVRCRSGYFRDDH
jgi:VWFA-related protein